MLGAADVNWLNSYLQSTVIPSLGIGPSTVPFFLEVGDPLSGTTYTDTVGGFTYHPQELAFSSWFYHQSPSPAVNGWYSDQGTFTTPAAACS